MATISKQQYLRQYAEAFAAAYELRDNVIEYAYQNTLAKMNDTARARSVNDLEPKERVVLHIIVLWAGVAVATARAKGVGIEEAQYATDANRV